VAAQTLQQNGPEMQGALRGRVGWLARETMKMERTYARNAANTIPASLNQEAAARDEAVRNHTTAVEQQRTRDAVEVPGLSPTSLAALENVRHALIRRINSATGNATTPSGGGRKSWSGMPGSADVPIRAWLASWIGSWRRPGRSDEGARCRARAASRA
jgi:hypothetical protein